MVKVKALEWLNNGNSSDWTGELIFGVYYLADNEGHGWRVTRNQFLSDASPKEVAFGDRESVLHAAQLDFNRVILSALEEE